MASRLTGLIVVLGATAGFATGDQLVAPQITVDARYASDPEPALLFELRAKAAHAVFEADLPWGNFYSVRLTFRNAAGKQVCPLLAQPIDDPSDEQVSITLGQVLSGRVALLPRCPSLLASGAQGPVTVEWAYTPVVHKLEGEPIHGRVTMPSRK